MANLIYDSARAKFADGFLSWSDQWTDVLAVLVTSYTFSNSHGTMQDVFASGGQEVAAANIMNRSVDATGACDADDTVFASVSGAQITAVLVVQDKGYGLDPADAHLIAHYDTGVGFPYTPQGGNITVQWDNSTNKVFRL